MTEYIAIVPWHPDWPLDDTIAETAIGVPVTYWLDHAWLPIGEITKAVVYSSDDPPKLVLQYRLEEDRKGALSIEANTERVVRAAFIPALRVVT